MMWLYIAAWFVVIVAAVTGLGFLAAPDERNEVRAMLAVRRANRKGRHRV